MVIGSILGAIIGIALGTIVYSILIWIVGKLGIGMKVDGFSPALIAGLLVAIAGALAGMVGLMLDAPPQQQGFASAVSHLIIAAAMLRMFGRRLKGVHVNGWGGAFLAAAAIAVVGWLITFGLSAALGGGG